MTHLAWPLLTVQFDSLAAVNAPRKASYHPEWPPTEESLFSEFGKLDKQSGVVTRKSVSLLSVTGMYSSEVPETANLTSSAGMIHLAGGKQHSNNKRKP